MAQLCTHVLEWPNMIFHQKSNLNKLLGDEPHPDAVVGLPPTLGVARLVDDRHHVAGLQDKDIT